MKHIFNILIFDLLIFDLSKYIRLYLQLLF